MKEKYLLKPILGTTIAFLTTLSLNTPALASTNLDNTKATVQNSQDVSKWLNSHRNKKWIWNSSPYGAQCVDLFDYYFKDVTGKDPPLVVGAKDLWSMPGNLRTYFEKVPASHTPRQGDVAVWDYTWGKGYGHVAVVIKPVSKGKIKVLSNNIDGTAKQPALLHDYSTKGLLGYLRPKVIASNTIAAQSKPKLAPSASSRDNTKLTIAKNAKLQKLPWSDETFAVNTSIQNNTVSALTKTDLKKLNSPKIETVSDIKGTEYYAGGKSGLVWGVTPSGSAVELSFDQWMKVGSPVPKKDKVWSVKHLWDDKVWSSQIKDTWSATEIKVEGAEPPKTIAELKL
ncbi:MAG: CHAP domain-containing protein [Micrococcaceae bacterium]